jgi:hypothetical protein
MKNILFLLTLLVLVRCSSDEELEKSIFKPDEEFPSLPEYSEWGYNTFGAFYDRQSFVSNDEEVPVKVINNGGNTSFVFSGAKRPSDYNSIFFSMTLKITGLNPSACNDLITLNNTTLDLSDAKYEVVFDDKDGSYVAQVMSGTFKIIRAQNLSVDDKFEEVILSGVFDFKALVDGLPVSISNGRFDVGVSSNNFFKY